MKTQKFWPRILTGVLLIALLTGCAAYYKGINTGCYLTFDKCSKVFKVNTAVFIHRGNKCRCGTREDFWLQKITPNKLVHISFCAKKLCKKNCTACCTSESVV